MQHDKQGNRCLVSLANFSDYESEVENMAKWQQAYDYKRLDNGEIVPDRIIKGRHECSECGHEAFYIDDPDVEYLTPYCPWCGAKLENSAKYHFTLN